MTYRSVQRGLSLIEVLVVVLIIGILVSMGYSALYSGKSMSREATCVNNLKQISTGLGLYYNDHGCYPPENLSALLVPYVGGNPDLFICPSDPDPHGDSYSRFYVARVEDETQDYVCGCPRHVDDSKAITLFSSQSAQLLEMQAATWNGQVVAPGTEVGSGLLKFADGTRVLIPRHMVVRLIQSFRMADGRLYSLIGLGVNETGTLNIHVTPGSRFEVITPSAIAGVQGTRFLLTAYVDDDDYCVRVAVFEGRVVIKRRWRSAAEETVRAGDFCGVTLDRSIISRLFPVLWETRRVILPDDAQFDPTLPPPDAINWLEGAGESVLDAPPGGFPPGASDASGGPPLPPPDSRR